MWPRSFKGEKHLVEEANLMCRLVRPGVYGVFSLCEVEWFVLKTDYYENFSAN